MASLNFLISYLWIIILLFCILTLSATYWYIKPREKKLSSKEIKYFIKKLEECYDFESKFGIIQIDTIIENILKAKGGQGNLGNMLRTLPKGNIRNNLWKYHKMRNILVHEAKGVPVTRNDVETYLNIAKSLLR